MNIPISIAFNYKIIVFAPSDELKTKFGDDCFVEWEVVSDDSGIFKDFLADESMGYKNKNEFYVTMPNNDVVLRAVIKHEHDYEFTKTVAPTCTEEGYDLYTCKYCDETLKKNVKAALGHDWDEGKVTKKATTTSEGEISYTCKHCHETKIEKIPKLTKKPTVSLRQVKLNKLKAKIGNVFFIFD